MKRLTIFCLVLLLASPVGVARALDFMLSQDQIEHIRNNCSDTQNALQRLHVSDALAYVNTRQQYETLSSRLMAPMNSRVALNKLDGVELTKTTVEFNDELNRYRKSVYSDYEQTLSAAIAMNCYDQPVEFYDTLISVLQKRTFVRASVDKMAGYLTQYRDQVNEVEKKVLGGGDA